MSKWSLKPVELPPLEFDGDTIVAVVSRLKTSEMAEMVGKKFDISTAEGQLGITQLGEQILPGKLKELRGLTDEDGAAVSVETYLEHIGEFYFAPITAHILFSLMRASSAKADEKNSAAQSGGSSEASGLREPSTSQESS